MKFKGTKGEWKISVYETIHGTKSTEIHFGNDGECVAEHVANMHDAQLIASAPELLKALVGVLNIVNESTGVQGYHLNGEVAEWDEFDEIKYAETVIQKAIG